MRKLILGIVAVICAQITFQIFTAVDTSDADRRARLATGPLVEPVSDGYADDVAELPSNDDASAVDTASITRIPAARRAVTIDTAIYTASYSRLRPRNVNAAAVVAMIERPAAPDLLATQNTIYSVHLDTKEVSRTHKRSFFAKVLPVVKKPYDWLKTVASNLK